MGYKDIPDGARGIEARFPRRKREPLAPPQEAWNAYCDRMGWSRVSSPDIREAFIRAFEMGVSQERERRYREAAPTERHYYIVQHSVPFYRATFEYVQVQPG